MFNKRRVIESEIEEDWDQWTRLRMAVMRVVDDQLPSTERMLHQHERVRSAIELALETNRPVISRSTRLMEFSEAQQEHIDLMDTIRAVRMHLLTIADMIAEADPSMAEHLRKVLSELNTRVETLKGNNPWYRSPG